MHYCKVMRKSLILMLVVTLTVVTGCDFFRKIAGRPTTEDIENKRVAIMRAEEVVRQARQDSIKKEHQKMVDSLAVMDSIRQQKCSMINPSALGGLLSADLEARYYIIIGSFRSRTNAETLLNSASVQKYSPHLLLFRNGLVAVGVAPADLLKTAYASLQELRAEKFYPSDAWILVNE